MGGVKIPHDTYVLVGDGRKALILRNEGDEVYPNLQVEQLFEQENPATHEQGADRPGRLHDPFNHKSAVADTDWHKLEEHRFARTVADRLYQMAHRGRFERLIVVAPPRTLSDLRQALHKEVRERVIAEIGKDLTGHRVDEMERILTTVD